MLSLKADLHTHTVLSPCGSLEMSPEVIIRRAMEEQIGILGITDHNSLLMCDVMQRLGKKNNIFIMAGCEVSTKEEIHCLAFFNDARYRTVFQDYLDSHLPNIRNNPDKFGYQLVVNEKEEILMEVDKLLISGINQSIEQVAEKVAGLNGIFIPAHIDRAMNSIISQLGFIPPGLEYDALELSKFSTRQSFLQTWPGLSGKTFIQSSDAHFPENIGSATTRFIVEEASFEEVRMALRGQNNRKVDLI